MGSALGEVKKPAIPATRSGTEGASSATACSMVKSLHVEPHLAALRAPVSNIVGHCCLQHAWVALDGMLSYRFSTTKRQTVLLPKLLPDVRVVVILTTHMH